MVYTSIHSLGFVAKKIFTFEQETFSLSPNRKIFARWLHLSNFDMTI